MYDVAVKHMTEILACSHQSKTTQELFLSDFLQVVEVIVPSTWFSAFICLEPDCIKCFWTSINLIFLILEIVSSVNIYFNAELDSI